jgi:hypothetical protein
MVMGFLRTMYKTKARLGVGGPIVTIQWYSAPPAGKIFPFPHKFYPILWVTKFPQPQTMRLRDPAPEPDPDGVGESQWRFTNTKDPGPRKYKGLCWIGNPEWYSSGVPSSAITPPFPLPPLCCRDPDPPPVTTPCDPRPIPATLRFTVLSWSCDPSVLPATFDISYTPGFFFPEGTWTGVTTLSNGFTFQPIFGCHHGNWYLSFLMVNPFVPPPSGNIIGPNPAVLNLNSDNPYDFTGNWNFSTHGQVPPWFCDTFFMVVPFHIQEIP